MRESGECEITPSTDVKYPQGSITSPHNQWLLIGVEPGDMGVPCALMVRVAGGGSSSCWGVSGAAPAAGVFFGATQSALNSWVSGSPSGAAVTQGWLQLTLVPTRRDISKPRTQFPVRLAVPLRTEPCVQLLG